MKKLLIFIILNICMLFFIYRKFNINSSLREDLIKKDENYTYIEDVPDDIKNGIILLEDRRFYYHIGVDPISIVRAFIENIKNNKVVQGGSTITQQLAKNLYLSNERSFKRKFKELYIALNLELRFSKSEILEMYLNVIYYGEGAYGIKSASKVYFNKDLNQLTREECAILVSIPQNPTIYNPMKKSTNLDVKKKHVVELLKLNDLSLSKKKVITQ